MKNLFKNLLLSTIGSTLLLMSSCKKDILTESPLPDLDNYTSVKDFYTKNQARLQTFSVNATTGGSFTCEKGTKITIPANAFVDVNGSQIHGDIKFNIKEIYDKSDMLLSNKPTSMFTGIDTAGRATFTPLKSGGEVFIQPVVDSGKVFIQKGKNIDIAMPTPEIDGNMQAFVEKPIPNDTIGQFLWQRDTVNTVKADTNTLNYIYKLYSFSSNNDQGTWCNSDSPTYFPVNNQVTIKFAQTDNFQQYNTNVFLVFKNVKSMVHVYSDGATGFPYDYAPNNEECTLVAMGIKDGKVFSSFTPITITSGANINFSLKETTTDEFKTKLKTLN